MTPVSNDYNSGPSPLDPANPGAVALSSMAAGQQEVTQNNAANAASTSSASNTDAVDDSASTAVSSDAGDDSDAVSSTSSGTSGFSRMRRLGMGPSSQSIVQQINLNEQAQAEAGLLFQSSQIQQNLINNQNNSSQNSDQQKVQGG